jgi:5-methylcytosine-specific restriction protein B
MDLPAGDTNGLTYVAYLDSLKPIQKRVSEALGREADLIDTQSFLWVNREKKEASSWRELLSEWLKHNSRTIPPDLRALRDEFVERFPKGQLPSMSLEQYAEGQELQDTFCNWVEFKTIPLGDVRGSTVRKWGVWWDSSTKGWLWTKAFKDENDALSRITSGLQALVKAVEDQRLNELDSIGQKWLGSSNSLRCKPLSLYFPDEFLPIFQPEHLIHFLMCFGASPKGPVVTIGEYSISIAKLRKYPERYEAGNLDQANTTWFENHREEILEALSSHGGVLTLNRQLLSLLRDQTEFEGFDTHQMMKFLYECLPPKVEEENNGKKIWKIAPGEDAKYWEMCKECDVVVHWISDVDFRNYSDRGRANGAD